MQKDFKTLWRLFLIFFKAGTFTFAGGLSMLPLIKEDICEKYKLLSEESFLEYVALAQSLPGVVAVNTAIFTGKRAAGYPGAVFASLGAIVPAFAGMLIVTILVNLIPRTGLVEKIFMGVRAASAALILSAAYTLGKATLKNRFAVIVTLVSFSLIVFLKINAFPVVIAAGAAGLVYNNVSRIGKNKGGEDKKDDSGAI